MSFPRGKRPVSGSGQDQKGQLSPRIRVHEEKVKGKPDQVSPDVKIEAVESLGPIGINCWQEVKVLQMNHFQPS